MHNAPKPFSQGPESLLKLESWAGRYMCVLECDQSSKPKIFFMGKAFASLCLSTSQILGEPGKVSWRYGIVAHFSVKFAHQLTTRCDVTTVSNWFQQQCLPEIELHGFIATPSAFSACQGRLLCTTVYLVLQCYDGWFQPRFGSIPMPRR